MTITICDLMFILLVHWLGDFVTQSDAIAKAKSKSMKALCRHVGTYTLVLLFVGLPFMRLAFFGWVAFNGAAHFATDYFTSKWVSHFFAKDDVHNAFVMIGLDQAIHLAILTASFALLVVN